MVNKVDGRCLMKKMTAIAKKKISVIGRYAKIPITGSTNANELRDQTQICLPEMVERGEYVKTITHPSNTD